jgi:hypothetical protein
VATGGKSLPIAPLLYANRNRRFGSGSDMPASKIANHSAIKSD